MANNNGSTGWKDPYEEQLKSYLKAAGFTHIAVYADRLFEAPRPGEQRIYIKARKGKVK